MKKLLSLFMLLLLLLCILPQMNGTARAEDEEPHLISWTFDYDITTCGVFMEFVDEDGTCGNYDAIRENYVAPGQTVTLPADSDATAAVIWLKTENAPYMTVGVNEGSTYEGFMMSGDMLERHSDETVRILGPYEEKYYAVNEMILTDIHEDMIYTISILPTEEAYDEYLLYNLPGGLEIVSLVCNVPFEPVPSTDINIFRKIDFYDEMCYLIIPDGNDDREMSFLLYPEEGQEIIDCSYSVAKGLKVLDNNVYSITLPVKSDYLSFRNCCSFAESDPQISINTFPNASYTGTISFDDSTYDLSLTSNFDYCPYSNLDNPDDPVTLTLSGNGTEIRGLVISSGNREEYVHGDGTDEIVYSFVPSDYPGGIMIMANPFDLTFDSHYKIDYDYKGIVLATDSHGKSLILSDDEPPEYEAGETITFSCYDFHHAEMTPYRVDIYDHTSNEITTLYAYDFEDNTFSYTPAGAYGFHIRLYWSMQEWAYNNYEEYIDRDAHAAGIFDLLYSEIDLSLQGCTLVEMPTEYPFINAITYNEETWLFFAKDPEYGQDGTEEEPLFHFAVLPYEGWEYDCSYIPDMDGEPLYNPKRGTYEFGMYNLLDYNRAEIIFYGDEEPEDPYEEPWTHYGQFLIADTDRFDVSITINDTTFTPEYDEWVTVPMYEGSFFEDVTITYRPLEGDEYPEIIKGLQVYYGDCWDYDFFENDSDNPYEFTITVNGFDDGLIFEVPFNLTPVNNEIVISASDDTIPVTVHTDADSTPVKVKYDRIFRHKQGETLYFRFLNPNGELPFLIKCFPTDYINNDETIYFDRDDFVDGYLPFTPGWYGYAFYVYYTADDYYIQHPNELPLFSDLEDFYNEISTVTVSSDGPELVQIPSDSGVFATSLHSGNTTAIYLYNDETCTDPLVYGFRIDGDIGDYTFLLDWDTIPADDITVRDDIVYVTCPYDMLYHDIVVHRKCSFCGCMGEISKESESFVLNFFIDLIDDDPGDYSVKTSYNCNGKAVTGEYSLWDCFYEGSYMVPVDVYAKCLNEDVTVQIIKNGTVVSSKTCSYTEYLTELLDDEDASDYHEIAKAMLNYGAAAQNYFDYSTNNLANAALSDDDKILGNIPDLSDWMILASGESELGFSFYGYSLTLSSQLLMNLYFEWPESVDSEEQIYDTPITCDCEDFTCSYNNGYLIVSVPFGWFDPWDEPATITVDGIEVKCTPLGYLYSAMESTANDDLKTVCNAIYDLYNACAELQ